MAVLNWRRVVNECNEIKLWLNDQGFINADPILLRLLALAGTRDWLPEVVFVAALKTASVPEALLTDWYGINCREIPHRIAGILSGWSRDLPKTKWFLGEIYERLATGKRVQGLFYTAPEIIDYIIAHTVETVDIINNPYIKILDPACGCGYFLLSAYDALRRIYEQNRAEIIACHPELDFSDDGLHRHIITFNLWGADINPAAIEIASAGLLFKGRAKQALSPNLLVCDSLRRPDNSSNQVEKDFWTNTYDIIIGNPPYVSFGLRGTRKLDSKYELYLRKEYNDSAEYKLSYYALFMQRSIELLAEGGKLGFIVPDSFLLGRYYSKIRRYILNHTTIGVIAHITAPVFKQAVVGMLAICIFTKKESESARNENIMSIYQVAEKSSLLQELTAVQYSQNYFCNSTHNKFRLFPDLTVKTLIDKIDEGSFKLAEFAKGHSGIRSKTKQNDIVADLPKCETWRPGLISGKQVKRYGLDYQGHWLNIDSDKLYKGGWDEKLVKQRKILLRQTGDSLVACIDNDGYYHLNNLHSFVPVGQSANIDYLLIILNSRLLSFYYHAVTLEYGRAMAQTDIDTLKQLPLRIDGSLNSKAPEFVATMQNLVNRFYAGQVDLAPKIETLDNLINQLVYKIYALSYREIEFIEKYEAGLISTIIKNKRLSGAKR